MGNVLIKILHTGRDSHLLSNVGKQTYLKVLTGHCTGFEFICTYKVGKQIESFTSS